MPSGAIMAMYIHTTITNQPAMVMAKRSLRLGMMKPTRSRPRKMSRKGEKAFSTGPPAPVGYMPTKWLMASISCTQSRTTSSSISFFSILGQPLNTPFM